MNEGQLIQNMLPPFHFFYWWKELGIYSQKDIRRCQIYVFFYLFFDENHLSDKLESPYQYKKVWLYFQILIKMKIENFYWDKYLFAHFLPFEQVTNLTSIDFLTFCIVYPNTLLFLNLKKIVLLIFEGKVGVTIC